jgi:hypothetical protein
LSRFTSTKVINTRWRNNDFVGVAGSTHTFPDQFHDEFLVDWALQISDGSIVITETPTTGVIQMSSLTVVDIVLTGTATGNFGAGGAAIIGTSPISVATAAGTSTISLNASYSTTSHLHDGTYQPFGTYITAVNGTAPIAASTDSAGISTVSLTASYATSTHNHAGVYLSSITGTSPIVASADTTGAATVSVSTGTTSATVAVGSHLHDGTYQPFGTYITAVNGTAPITSSTDTAGVVTVGLSASYQTAGTYITAVNGTAPIAVSTTTAGVSTVSLTASYDSAGTAASTVSTHAAVTTSVHGITDTANLLTTSTSFATISNATATATTISSTTSTAPTDIAGLSHVFTPTYNEDVLVQTSVVYTQSAASTAIIDLIGRIIVNGTIVTPQSGFVRLAANHSSPTGLTLTTSHTFAAVSGTPYTAKVAAYKTVASGTYSASNVSSFTIIRTRA